MRRGAILAMALVSAFAQARFSDDERQAVVRYWATPGRYVVGAPKDAAKSGPWQVRLTPEGSTWLWTYNRARGVGKGPPTQDAGARNPGERDFERWIETKVAYDRWLAARDAREANMEALGRSLPPVEEAPAEPGPVPRALVELAGNPPAFAAAVAPLRHTVRFDDGTEITYNDNVPMRPRYAYYRFAQGVMYGGQAVRAMPSEELSALLAEAGVAESEGRVMRAVSMLEGGFDSVNTYDTGFVSVGLIQFACLKDGAGSLGTVLQTMKADSPEAFQQDLRRFGIDVTDTGALQVVDPGTGGVTVGAAAAQVIIADKRLIAVFQRAGAASRPFRIAQLRTAKKSYYPADDVVTIKVGQETISGKVSDFIRSEAGMAILMDRKVNTGKIDVLTTAAARVARERGARTLADLVPYEREIVTAVRFRKDYLQDTTLSQPPGGSVARGGGKKRVTTRRARSAKGSGRR